MTAPARNTVELTEKQIRRLAQDAALLAAVVILYAPTGKNSERTQAAARRTLRLLGHDIQKRFPR